MIELTTPDRALIDNLTAELAKYNAMMDDDVIVSCTEAGRLLGVSNVTVSHMIRDGRLNKAVRGKSNGILLSEVRRIQNSRRRDGTARISMP